MRGRRINPVTTLLTDEEHDRFEQAARSAGKSKAGLMRELVDVYVDLVLDGRAGRGKLEGAGATSAMHEM